MSTGVHHPWDTRAKLWLIGQIQALVNYLMPGAIVESYALDKELLVKKLVADFFFLVHWNGEWIILHIEFQRYKDEDMGRRMWEYNGNKDQLTGLRVYSVLIYLVPQKDIVESPYERLVAGYGHRFTFVVLKLWEMDPEIFKHPNRNGLLPLLPLTKGGKNRETVKDMVKTIQERNCDDLLELAYHFAALLFKGKGDKEWLKEEFPMLNTLPILQKSWRVQEVMEWGREEVREEAARAVEEATQIQQESREEAARAREEAARAREEAARAQQQAQQQMVIALVTARFPQLAQLAQALVTLVNDAARLQVLNIALSTVPDEEQATALLTSLVTKPSEMPLIPPITTEQALTPIPRKRGLRGLFGKFLFGQRRL